MSIGLRCSPYSYSITNAVVIGLEWRSGKFVLLWSLHWEWLRWFFCSLSCIFMLSFLSAWEHVFCPFHYLFPANIKKLFVWSTPTAIWWICHCQKTFLNIPVHISSAEGLMSKWQVKALNRKKSIRTPRSWGFRWTKPLEIHNNNSVIFLLRLVF